MYRLTITNEQGKIVRTNLCESVARAKAQANIHANTILVWEVDDNTQWAIHYGFLYLIERDDHELRF